MSKLSTIEEIRENSAKLNKCITPHAFTILLDRITKEPIKGIQTLAMSFGAYWRCAKCGGEVATMEKIWYENGLRDGIIHAAWTRHKGEQAPEQDAIDAMKKLPGMKFQIEDVTHTL